MEIIRCKGHHATTSTEPIAVGLCTKLKMDAVRRHVAAAQDGGSDSPEDGRVIGQYEVQKVKHK